MRPFEILSLILLSGSLFALVKEKNRDLFLYLLFASTVSTILQYLIEGLRWQLLPAIYLLPTIFIVYKFYYKNKISIFLEILLLCWLFFAIFIPWAVPVFTLPEPGGEYYVGTETFHWIDSTRKEWFTVKDIHDKREIVVQAWYPSKEKPNTKSQPYMDFMKLRAQTLSSAGDIPSIFPSHLNRIKTNSYKNLKCIKTDMLLPVLVFSHGITGSRHLHQALFEYLASRGYVVLAPNHSFDSNLTIFPDGRTAEYRSEITGHPDSVLIREKQINTRSLDIHFIIKKLNKINNGIIPSSLVGNLDLGRIALGGHSFGGATAILSSHNNKTIGACFVLDGWMNPIPSSVIKSGLQAPFMSVGRPSWLDSGYPDNYTKLDTLVLYSLETNYNIIINNTRHLDYTDIPLLSPIIRFFMEVGSLSSKKSIPLVNELVYGFLEKHFSKNNLDILDNVLKNRNVVNR